MIYFCSNAYRYMMLCFCYRLFGIQYVLRSQVLIIQIKWTQFTLYLLFSVLYLVYCTCTQACGTLQ
jgi:hypothetical protein